jgi:hypothetical protein
MVSKKYVEGEKRGRRACLIWSAMALDFDHVELVIVYLRSVLRD